jgi:hypothetical protein
MSGLGGIVFSDGSFEFRNVPPGRHTIATLDSPGRAVGASIVVGSLDVEDVELEDIAIAPADIQTPRAPAPADGLLPGTKLSRKAIRGRVIDQSTQQPVPSGKAVLNSSRSPFYQLNEEGSFEIPHLLPGSYKLEIQIFGYQVMERQIEVGLEDVVVNLAAQKLQ